MTESIHSPSPQPGHSRPAHSQPLLALRQLSCERDERVLFNALDACFYPGELVQISGPNGSGKTSLLRLLAGVSTDYDGEILWRGRPLPEARWDYARDFIYLGHLSGIKKALTPEENLAWYSASAGSMNSESVAAALASVGLDGYEDTPCYQLSAGQARRVALARLHLTRASIWILDEPFTAIDKEGVTQLERVLAGHVASGGLVILTSHQELALSGVRVIDLLDYSPRVSDKICYTESLDQNSSTERSYD